MNRIILITTFCAGLALLCPAHAQQTWNPGEATLFTGVTIRGELSYRPETNALLVRRGDKVHAYTAGQLQKFDFVETETFARHYFGVYTVLSTGEHAEIALIFEELTPVISTPMLQLPGNQAVWLGRKYGLPRPRSSQWRTTQPRYVWLEGQFIALDVFVETELNALLATSPEAVQRWAASYPKPVTPNELGAWLSRYHGQMGLAKPRGNGKLITQVRPY